MPTLRKTKRFEVAVTQLPKEALKKLQKALRLLAENPRHPSLQTKPIRGRSGLYEARLDQNYRISYERQPGDILILRTVGLHDETLRNP